MCSRFELNATARDLAGRFRLAVPPPLPNRAEVRPTDAALVIAAEGGRLARWGLEVSWDKRPLINARAETLASRPSFRRLLGCRILVPATAWWEWRQEVAGRKTKMRLMPAVPLFALAGLLDGERFTVVTCAAAAAVAALHDRMPALLRPEDEALWLDPDRPFAEAAAALAPYPGPITATADDSPPVQGSLF